MFCQKKSQFRVKQNIRKKMFSLNSLSLNNFLNVIFFVVESKADVKLILREEYLSMFMYILTMYYKFAGKLF